jgi:bacteriorhodopsin
MTVLPRTNDALEVNPPAGDELLSTNGSNWLWAVTAIYAFSFVCRRCFLLTDPVLTHFLRLASSA